MSKLAKLYRNIAAEWPLFVGVGAGLLGWEAILMAFGLVLAIHNERFKTEESYKPNTQQEG